ncbi:MAG: InlB B-repeat-containing protein, partial [Treponema sp.]|nr:InlB B-repeat-containing protein [Treponema sp.]
MHSRSAYSVFSLRSVFRAFVCAAVFFCALPFVGATNFCWKEPSGNGNDPDSWNNPDNWYMQNSSWQWVTNTSGSYPTSPSVEELVGSVFINTEDAGTSIIVYITEDAAVQNLYLEASDTTTVTLVLSEGVTLTVGMLTFGHIGGNSDTVDVIITGAGTVIANSARYTNSSSTSTISLENGAVLSTNSFIGGNSGSIEVTGDGSGTLIAASTGTTISVDSETVTYGNNPGTYYVTLDANGGTFGTTQSRSTLSVTQGSELALTAIESLSLQYAVSAGETGKAFVGWASSKTATEALYADGESFTPGSSQTLYAVWKDVTTYFWRQDKTSGNWTDSANWLYSDSTAWNYSDEEIEDRIPESGEPPASAVYYPVCGGYPGIAATDTTRPDFVFIPAPTGSTVTVTLTSDITLFTVQFGSYSNESNIVLNTAGYTLSTAFVIIHNSYYSLFDSTLTVSGGGTLKTEGLDAPNNTARGSTVGHINTVEIASGTEMYITGENNNMFWGNANTGDPGYTNFTGAGKLHVLASGANVEWGPTAVRYDSSLTRIPYKDPTYYDVIIDSGTSPISDTGLKLTFKTERIGGEAAIPFSYTATVSGDTSFTFGDAVLESGENTGEVSISYEAGVSTFVYYLKASTALSETDSITLKIMTPDGSLPLAEYTYPGAIWTGEVSDDWETAANWSGNEVPDATSEVIIPSGCTNYPLLTSSQQVTVSSVYVASGARWGFANGGTLSVSSMYVATNAEVWITDGGGTLEVSSFTTSGTGKFNASQGTVVFTGDASWTAEYTGLSSFPAVQIADGCTLTLNGSMGIPGTLKILQTGTVDLQGNTIECAKFILNTASTPGSGSVLNVNATLTGGGIVKTWEFDFPNAYQHTLTIDSDTTLQVEDFFAGASRVDYTGLLVKGSGTLRLPASGTWIHELNGKKSYSIADTLTVEKFGEPTYYKVNALGNASGVEVSFIVGRTGSVSAPFLYWVKATGGAVISDFTLGGTALDSTATSAENLAETAVSFDPASTTTLILTYAGSSPLPEGAGGYLHIYTPDGLFELGVIEYIQGGTPVWTGEVSSSWTTGGNWNCGYMPAFGSLSIPDGCPNYPVITATDGPADDVVYTEITLSGESSLTLEGGSLTVTECLLLSDSAVIDVDGGSLTVTEPDSDAQNKALVVKDNAEFWLTSGSATLTSLTQESAGESSVSGGTLTVSSSLELTNGEFTVTDGAISASSATLSLSGFSLFSISGGEASFDTISVVATGEYLQSGGTVTVANAVSVQDGLFSQTAGALTAALFELSGEGLVLFSDCTATFTGAINLSG